MSAYRKTNITRTHNAKSKIEDYIREEVRKAGRKEAIIPRPAIMDALGVSIKSIRLTNRLMAESGRWEVIPGYGSAATTYRLLED